MGRSQLVPSAAAFWSLARGGQDECWDWPGRRDEKGYGRLGFGGRRNVRAHRVAWELMYGEIPGGQVVCHSCDNPACVNPNHLFLGSQLENIADRDAKARGTTPPSRRKLTIEQATAIRSLHEQGFTQVQIAARFPISRGNVSKVINRKVYSDV